MDKSGLCDAEIMEHTVLSGDWSEAVPKSKHSLLSLSGETVGEVGWCGIGLGFDEELTQSQRNVEERELRMNLYGILWFSVCEENVWYE